MATISFSCACFRAIFLGALIFSLTPPSAGLPLEELERAITVLRIRGRALFANAIITSDLLFDLLSVESLTLFAPTDSMLYDLDMTHSFSYYVATLRLHSVPLRLPFSDLRSLPNASSLPTILPSHHLILTKPSPSNDSIYLDGVHILLPGLFYGQHLAVHGLAEILPLTAPTAPPSPEFFVALPPVVDSPAPNSPPSPEFFVALPPVVDSPAESPPVVDSPAESPTVVDSPVESPWIVGSRFSPAPEPYLAFLGRTPAESPRVEEVSPSPWRDDMIVGDEGGPLDMRSNHF